MLALGMMTGSRQVFDITLSSNQNEWVRSVDAPQVPSNTPVLLILRVASAIQIQSDSPSVAALYIDELADGSAFYLFNSGYVIGDGGPGGSGGTGGSTGGDGQDGGDAIYLGFNGYAEISNSGGRIWGGGGGGGAGGGCQQWSAIDGAYEPHEGGGGGGGGAGGGTAGSAGTGASAGSTGTTGSSGVGGAGGADGDSNNSGDGGTGGEYGEAGDAGGTGFKHGGPADGALNNGGAGGASGYAIRHLSGTTVSFVAGQSSPNVKGSVGT